MRRALPLLLAVIPACHQPREMAPQIPLEGIDGKYTFTMSQPFKMEGQLLVAYSEVHLLSPKHCVPIEGPKSSDELRASWFECLSGGQARPGDESLRLRFSQVDLINRSRWFARMRERDTVVRCTRYTSSGDCTEILRARGMKWVDRNGAITVVRGFPAALDTSRTPNPNGTRPLRARCDTSATSTSCMSSRSGVKP